MDKLWNRELTALYSILKTDTTALAAFAPLGRAPADALDGDSQSAAQLLSKAELRHQALDASEVSVRASYGVVSYSTSEPTTQSPCDAATWGEAKEASTKHPETEK